jgi:P pilus assembly chaperone PapD
MPKRLALTAALACLLAASSRAEAQVLAQVNPARLSLSAPAGVPLSRDIQVSNLGTEPVNVHMRLSDWRTNAEGELSLAPAGSTSGTLQGLIEFSPESFTLSPGATLWVHVRLTPRADGAATRWGILLGEFKALHPDVVPGGRGRVELGTSFVLSRLPADAAIASLGEPVLTRAGRDSLEVAWMVRNAGQRHFSLDAKFALADSSGAALSTGASSAGVLLPGSTRDVAWGCPVPAPGRYRVSLTLDDGSGHPLASEVTLSWPLAAAAPASGASGSAR